MNFRFLVNFLLLLSVKTVLSYNPKTDTKFYLYTRKNPTIPQLLSPEGNLHRNFDPNVPTRFIIHGWKSDGFQSENRRLREAYLEHGSFNVIMVDWGILAHIPKYSTVTSYVPAIGAVTAVLIQNMMKQGSNASEILIVGHSLGSHIAGFAGKSLKTNDSPVLGSILGLDVAAPGFSIDSPETRLSDTDALYVQTIHTSSLGFAEPIGHGSFYPNYGKTQDGCFLDFLYKCSHNRPWEYLIESIHQSKTQFLARQCNTYSNIKEENCEKGATIARMMGEPLDNKAIGVFYLTTRPFSTYARGELGI